MNRNTSLILIGMILTASAAIAQTTPDSEIIIELKSPGLDGSQYDVMGVAAKITKNGAEMFVTKVAAAYEDGTILVVRGHRRDGAFDLGTIEMLLGSGSLELKNSFDRSKAFPLNGLMAITVEIRGVTLLEGRFDR